jgi:hypothetical protein
MADFDDLRLDRSRTEATPPPPPQPRWIRIVILVLLLAAAAAWYFLVRTRNQNEVTVRTETEKAVDAAGRDADRAAEPGADIPLPPIDESDPLVRDLVSELSSHPRVAAWLTTDQLIRNFTVVVVNISQGQTPARHLKAVAPAGEFQARTEGSTVILDPRSYARYDSHADAVAGIDARGAARLYATLKPRIDEAYRELGSPAGDFDTSLQKAIVEMLEVPVVEGEVRLKSDPVLYAYSDPALESLTHAQRQLLRMGPRNVRIIQNKLREIAGYLAIPAGSLPPERVVRARPQ